MSTLAPSTPPRESPRSPSGLEISEIGEKSLRDLFATPETGHVFVTDPVLACHLMAEREALGIDRKDEVWDGVYVMSPTANIEHQDCGGELNFIFRTILPGIGGGKALSDIGVSDRDKGWVTNHRVPDVCVYLAGNPARNCKTHMLGGPDLAVEVLSHRDPAREKLDFYASIDTREVLLIDREPWSLELYRLADDRLELVGVSTVERPTPLTSEVLPLSFRLLPGEDRPTLEVSQVGGGQAWRI